MKKMNLFLSMAIFALPFLCQAQSTDEDAIRQVIRRETEAYCKKDSAAWSSAFLMDSNTTRTNVASAGYFSSRGWSNFSPSYLAFYRDSPKPFSYANLVDSNYIIRVGGDVASVEYDQSLQYEPTDSTSISHELRTLKKVNGEWKLVSCTTLSTSTFTSADSVSIEDNLNGLGYRLLMAGKYNAAINLFALNVKMSPRSWNVYDSMGEAYMKSGNKALAIKNYETSVKLNPKNENGMKMLAELRKK